MALREEGTGNPGSEIRCLRHCDELLWVLKMRAAYYGICSGCLVRLLFARLLGKGESSLLHSHGIT